MIIKLSTAIVWILSLSTLTTGAPLSPKNPSLPVDNQGVCNTPACVQAAQAIHRNLDPNADPCEDFYQFACGGFDAREKIPEGAVIVSEFQYAQDRSDAIVRKILEASPDEIGIRHDKASRRILEKSQALYNSCMDEARLKQVGRQPLYDELQQLALTIYPAPESQLTSVFSSDLTIHKQQQQQDPSSSASPSALSSALAHLVRSGVDPFLVLSVTEDPANTATQGVYLRESGLSLPARELYADQAIMDQLQGLVQHMFTLVVGPQDENENEDEDEDEDGDENKATNSTWSIEAEQMARDVVAFEMQLANISTEARDRFNASLSINPHTLEQLGQRNAAVDWPLFLEKTLETTSMNGHKITVESPGYVDKLGQLLGQTAPAQLQHFFAWKMILSHALWLSSEYRRPIERFQAMLSGLNPELPPHRQETCVDATNAGVGSIVGHFYIAEAFPPASKKASEEIIQAVREVYMNSLMHRLPWLDNHTRTNAVAKLERLVNHVGYSTEEPDVRSPRSLGRFYARLEMDSDDFYGNKDRATRWRVERQLGQAGQATNKRIMLSDPQVVDAFYNPLRNEMLFPAAILQPNFFSAGRPEYLNFGGVGMVAGHEITHAFDSNGRTYDANGTYTDWWTNSTSAQFMAKAQCFVQQYSNFSIDNPTPGEPRVHIDGRLTLSENLADNGGVKSSFEAWQQRLASDPQGRQYNNQRLAGGLERYSREQLFFVSYAQLWCAKVRPEALLNYVLTDPHSPPVARVNGAVQNSHAFAKAFKCGPKARMNPATKCEIW